MRKVGSIKFSGPPPLFLAPRISKVHCSMIVPPITIRLQLIAGDRGGGWGGGLSMTRISDWRLGLEPNRSNATARRARVRHIAAAGVELFRPTWVNYRCMQLLATVKLQ